MAPRFGCELFDPQGRWDGTGGGWHDETGFPAAWSIPELATSPPSTTGFGSTR